MHFSFIGPLSEVLKVFVKNAGLNKELSFFLFASLVSLKWRVKYIFDLGSDVKWIFFGTSVCFLISLFDCGVEFRELDDLGFGN